MNTNRIRQVLLDKINWTHVEAGFRALGYEWYMHDGLRCPTANELRACAAGLLRDVKPDAALYVGRLRASHIGGTLRIEVILFEAAVIPAVMTVTPWLEEAP